jgi:hypothetical protein
MVCAWCEPTSMVCAWCKRSVHGASPPAWSVHGASGLCMVRAHQHCLCTVRAVCAWCEPTSMVCARCERSVHGASPPALSVHGASGLCMVRAHQHGLCMVRAVCAWCEPTSIVCGIPAWVSKRSCTSSSGYLFFLPPLSRSVQTIGGQALLIFHAAAGSVHSIKCSSSKVFIHRPPRKGQCDSHLEQLNLLLAR